MDNRSETRESFTNLLWASPYLLFMIPFIYVLVQQPIGVRIAITWLVLLAFIGLYVASWIIFKVCSRYLDWRVAVVILLMLGLNLLLGILTKTGETGFFLGYICSVIVFLVPKKLIPPFMGLVVLEFILILYLFPVTEYPWIVIVLLIGILVSLISRNSLEKALEQKLYLAEIEYRSAEVERNRVSAQLHDTLGQTLTAINLHAQLVVKQIEHGHKQKAISSAETLASLARESLTQVRQVVQQNFELCFETEVEKSLALLKATNIELSTHNLAELPFDLRNIAAWMLREGTSNIIHHSTAQHAYLVANRQGVALINDGGILSSSRAHSGNGIKGLQARCDQSMRFRCGKLDSQLWQLWMGENPLPSHGPGFIMELTFKE